MALKALSKGLRGNLGFFYYLCSSENRKRKRKRIINQNYYIMTKTTISINAALNAPQSKGYVYETSLDKYFELTRNGQLAQLVGLIRQTEDVSQRRELKQNLPIRCPHYFRFKDNRRNQASIIPEAFTFQTSVDIDIVEQVEPALHRAYLLNNMEGGQWQGHLLHAERSASGKLHLDIRIPVGMTIEEAQRAYTEALGVEFDTNCISPERAIYITDAASQLYTSDDWYAQLPEEELALRRKAYTDRGLDIDGRQRHSAPMSNLDNLSMCSHESKNGLMAQEYPMEYKGIPYSMIIDELTKVMNGSPVHGERNCFIYHMACHLRAICNGESAWIRQIMPDFGEDRKRVDETIENACTYSKSMTMSKELKQAIWQAGEQIRTDKGQSSNGLHLQPQMPPVLPKPLDIVVSKAPMIYHPAIANHSFTSFATYTGGLKLRYYDKRIIEATQINGFVAASSSGKSCIKEPLKAIVGPLKERDSVNRERERQWIDECERLGSNKDKPERPEGLFYQCVKSDTTAAAFVKLSDYAERAGDKALWMILDEVDMFYDLAGGKKTKVTQILRRNYDTDEYGQERAGNEAVRADTILRANISFSATENSAKGFFNGQIENGTLSRVSFSTIVNDDPYDLPMFGNYDEKYFAKLQPYIERLEKAHGKIVDCKQARDLAKELIFLVIDRHSVMESNAYKALGLRSVESAFRKACLLYVMNNRKWNQSIADFMRWTFEYDMWVKMRVFGEMAAEAFGDIASPKVHKGPANLLEQLNDAFSIDDLLKVRNKGTSPDQVEKATNLVSQWKKRGFIEYVVNADGTKDYKKTETYLASRQSAA